MQNIIPKQFSRDFSMILHLIPDKLFFLCGQLLQGELESYLI